MMMLQQVDTTPLRFGRVAAHNMGAPATCYQEPIKFNGLPFDSVTVATETSHSEDNDDSSICSSVSCDIREETNRPRSIFGSYWVSQGYESSPFFRSGPQYCSLLSSSSESLCYTQESQRQQQAPALPEAANKPPSRRSIFGDVPAPTEVPQEQLQRIVSLNKAQHHPILFRKTKSAPVLSPRSAIRSGKFSSGKTTPSAAPLRTRSRSVSFSDEVIVALVPTASSGLVERFAEEGWSDWFA